MSKHSKAKQAYIDHVLSCQKCTGNKHCQKGAGLFDTLKEGYKRVKLALSGPRKKAPPVAREFLQKFGTGLIQQLRVCRKPIASGIDTALNLISLGQWSKNKKKLGYDQMFHLYFLMTINLNGQTHNIRVEKNQVVEIYHSDDPGEDCLPVPLTKESNVNDFIANGEKYQGESYWVYNPANNNCQIFVQSTLKGNGLYTPQLKAFTLQPAESLLTGFARRFAEGVTDIASRADILQHGEGQRKIKRKKTKRKS